MNKNLLFLLLILFTKITLSQQITELTSGANGVLYGDGVWIDINNDNTYEFVVAGNANYDPYAAVSSFDGSQFNVDSSVTLTQMGDASIDTADFNNDGFEDFIITGYNGETNVTLIYYNDGLGQFTQESTNIIGTTYGKIRATDLNDDGRPDVVITGMSNGAYEAKLYYQNELGEFVDSATSLMQNYFGDITFIDANNDGQKDILLTGFDNNYVPNTKLYINNIGVFTESTTHGIAQYYFTGTAVYDLDNDGDEDLVLSGTNSSYNGESAIYYNDGTGVFTKDITNSNTLEQVYFGDLDMVDFNNDGLVDIFSTGQDAEGNYISNLYINDDQGTFTLNTDVSNAIMGVAISNSDWVDFDNDGDKDLLLVGYGNDGSEVTSIYRNETTTLSISDAQINETKIYPNPVQDYLSIESKRMIDQIEITNVLSEMVLKSKSTQRLDLSNLKTGVYILNTIDINGQRSVFKFIKR